MDKSVLRQEIITCGRDPVHFIKKYIKIKHPVRGLIPFKTYDYQEDLVNDYKNNRFNVILKARQLGISEITAAYACWLMLFHREKNVVVMASKAETAKNILRKIRTSLKKLPRWLMLADIQTDNKLSIELSNGSRCVAIATSEDAGRSEAVSFLIIDEAAFIQRFDELWTGLYPTVAAGGACAILSTPNGVGNKFHEIYTDAEQGNNEFVPHRLMWYAHPERIKDLRDDPDRPGFKTSTWFINEVKAANMSPRDVAQELECNFNASGDTVISAGHLMWLASQTLDPVLKKYLDRNLYVWFAPSAGRRYLISADVARGDGRDHSAFHVFDAQTMDQVAEYYGKIPVEDYARLLCETGHEYGTAMLAVENTSVGLACLEHIRLLGYENVYYSRRGDHKPGESVNTTWGNIDPELVPGFTTSQKNRPLMISKLEEFIRNRSISIRSKRMYEELRTFIWNNGKPEAAKGSNDDLVMAGSIGAWIRDTYLAPNFVTVDIQKKMLGGIDMNRITNNQINGASKDPRDIPHISSGIYPTGGQSPTQMRLPRGKTVDFSWLYK